MSRLYAEHQAYFAYLRRALSTRGTGGIESILRNVSSNPIPSPLCSSFGEFGGGLGFDDFPDFVALNLSSIGEPLSLNVHQHGSGALHVIDAEGRAVVPAKIEFGSIALQMLFADAVEGAVEAALQDRKG